MESDRTEQLLSVPSEMTVSSKGLALDIGGSVVKFVYRTKEDYDAAVHNSDKLGNLRLVTFGRKELKEGLEYVRQRAHLVRGEDDQLKIYATGVGCTNFGKTISQALNIKLENLTEYDCFVRAFTYLAERLPRRDFLQPFIHDALDDPVEQMEEHLAFILAAQNQNLSAGLTNLQVTQSPRDMLMTKTGRHSAAASDTSSVELPLSQAEEDVFPCVIVMCGSGVGFMKVNKDGKFQILDGSNRGGKCFYGIGKLLTGCQSFEELIELASRGNTRNVDQFSDQVCDFEDAADGDDSIYKMMNTNNSRPLLLYCFGNVASGKSDYSREDLAASCLQMIVLDLAQTLVYCCRVHDVKRVFFCGGFCQDEVVRRCLTTELARRNLAASVMFPQSAPLTFDFIKAGHHLGALGSLLNGIEQSAEK